MARPASLCWPLVTAGVLLLAACPRSRGGGGGDGDDDDDDGAACGFDACGGDAVGHWRIVDSCVTFDSTPPDDCPEAQTSYGTPDVSGTLAIEDDGTYEMSTETSFDLTIDFPTSCLGGASCDLVEQNLVGSFPGSTCTDSALGCACTSPFDSSSTETGTWDADGDVVRVVDQGGDSEDLDYCATTGALALRSTAGGGTLEMFLEPE